MKVLARGLLIAGIPCLLVAPQIVKAQPSSSCYAAKMAEYDIVTDIVIVQVNSTKQKERFHVFTVNEQAGVDDDWKPLDSLKICASDISGIYEISDDTQHELIHAKKAP